MKRLVVSLVTVLFAFGNLINAQETPSIFTHQVGIFKVSLLAEAQSQVKESLLIGATPEMKEQTNINGTYPNAMNAFLVQTSQQNILIDAGLGTNIFSNMESLGVSPEKIDIILITHMHGDHIGGMLKNGEIAFPNAKVYIPQPEHDYWMSDKEMNKLPENKQGGFLNARKVIESYAGNIQLFQPGKLGDGTPIIPGFKGSAAYGHTPGHTIYLLESENDKFLVWGDVTHAMAIQMPYPQVALTYDVDPDMAIESRKEVLEYVVKNKIPIAGMHIAYPSMGSIQKSQTSSYIFTPFQ